MALLSSASVASAETDFGIRTVTGERAIILDAEPSAERLPTESRLALYDKLYAQMRRGS